MTESDALTKWCPMVRVNGFPRPDNGYMVATNREESVREDGSFSTLCIGSACLMFRSGWRIVEPDMEREEIVWCGLAGKP